MGQRNPRPVERHDRHGRVSDERIFRIAIVDDSPIIRAVVGHLLRDQPDSEVASFETARECLRWMADHDCNLLIADYHLAGLDGLGLTRHALKLNPALKVLVLTIDRDPEVESSFIEAGASMVLHKPFDTESLRRACRAIANLPGGSGRTDS